MKCRNRENGKECGVELPPGATFCGECGADVRTVKCPKCSEIVKETQKFCHGCKWKVDLNAFDSESVNLTEKKEKEIPDDNARIPDVPQEPQLDDQGENNKCTTNKVTLETTEKLPGIQEKPSLSGNNERAGSDDTGGVLEGSSVDGDSRHNTVTKNDELTNVQQDNERKIVKQIKSPVDSSDSGTDGTDSSSSSEDSAETDDNGDDTDNTHLKTEINENSTDSLLSKSKDNISHNESGNGGEDHKKTSCHESEDHSNGSDTEGESDGTEISSEELSDEGDVTSLNDDSNKSIPDGLEENEEKRDETATKTEKRINKPDMKNVEETESAPSNSTDNQNKSKKSTLSKIKSKLFKKSSDSKEKRKKKSERKTRSKTKKYGTGDGNASQPAVSPSSEMSSEDASNKVVKKLEDQSDANKSEGAENVNKDKMGQSTNNDPLNNGHYIEGQGGVSLPSDTQNGKPGTEDNLTQNNKTSQEKQKPDDQKDEPVTQQSLDSKSKPGTSNAIPESKTKGLHKCIDIYFHAIFSPTILSSKSYDTVFVKISGLTNDTMLQPKCDLGGGFVEYEGMVSIQKDLFRPHEVVYNYFVKIKNEHMVEEFVYNHGLKDFNNRSVKIQYWGTTEVHHQYDGVVRSKPLQEKEKGVFSKIYNFVVTTWKSSQDYENILREDAGKSIRTFLPQWEASLEIGLKGEEHIAQINCVLNGLMENYFRREQLWPSSDDFEKFATEFLRPYLEVGIKIILDNQTRLPSTNKKVGRLTTAATIVYLKEHYKVSMDYNVLCKLCEALLPNAESDQNCCPDLEEMNKSFLKDKKKKLTDYLLNMVKSMLIKGIDHSWLKCIPVLHYLQNKSQPFQVVPRDVNHHDPHPKWWGIETFKDELDTFKSKYKLERSPDEVFLCLLPYITIDFFLPRTYVASMTLQQLTKLREDTNIPADAILAAVYYFVKCSEINTTDANEFQKIFSTVSSVLRKAAADVRIFSAEDAKRTYKIASDLVQLVFQVKNVKVPIRTKFYISVSEPYVLSVCWFFKCMEVEGKVDADKSFEQKDKYKWCKQELCKELTEAEGDKYLTTEHWIRLWDQAMKIMIPKGTIKDDYVKYLQRSMEACLSNKKTEENLQPIIDVYCNSVEEFAPELQEVLSSCAFRAVETCANYIPKTLPDSSSEKRLKHYGSLLSHVFDRNLDADKLKDKASYVHYALSWAQFPVFVKMYMTEGYAKYLGPVCSNYMKCFTDVLKRVNRELIDATITLENLEYIINEKQHYISIVTEMKEFEKESVEEILNIRDKEFKTFNRALSTVKEFIYTCKKIKGDTDDLEERLKVCQDTKQAKLETVCNALKPTEITSEGPANVLLKKFTVKGFKGLAQYNPCLVAFGLDEDILKQLPQIVEYSISDSFNQVWTKRANELSKEKGSKITITEIVEDVWEPAKQFWADLCQKLKDGDLLFSEFDEYFATSDLAKLKQELIQFNKGDTNISWIKMRLDQISNYKNIFICLKGANAINEIAKKYQLNGDFSHISNIINMTSGGDTPMKTFDDSLVKTCSILKGIDDKKVECLNVFSRCADLITWLRKSMKTGLKELKVFVELANMSAGETDIEVDRVQFLHAATTGYAPLIFNLDSNCSDIVFLQKCEIVWKELEADPKLPKKLKDTCQHLEWFKSVKKSHGSIEVSSLSQTEAINAFGTYEVGNSKGKLIHKPELKNILDLSVIYEEASTEQEDSKGPRIVQYKYEQLLDLQSRLMLIAGKAEKAEKGKEEVDRFMLILDSVVRLGNIYIKLVTDGCVLFNYWHSSFLCDKSRPVCTFVNFGHGKDMLTLKCRIDESTDDVSAIIPKLAKILEKCHDQWLDYINEKRKQYPLLNLFNIDQIVILQKELVRIGTDKEPSALIYPILSAVKKDCTRQNLTTAMSKAKAEISSSEIPENSEVDVEKLEVDEGKEKLLDELTKNDFSVSLAIEALKHCDNIEDAIDWCYDHEGSFVNQEENQSKETMFTGWTQSGQSMASFTASLVTQLKFKRHSSFRKLKKALEKLWATFLNSISSSVSDYLSVEHLGIILNKLFEQETYQVCRTMPSYFKIGEPNLVICPQSEMYNTALSLYIDENESLLPQSDEVLLCTVNTSIDMVEIFWRRALYPGSKKLYCIVNIDLLDYEVGDKAERTLQRLMKDAEYNQAKYNLVVLCSTENENKSVIVRSLAKYHRNQVPVNVFKIQEYLATKLKMEEAQTNVPSASAVDFDKSSVRVVQSWRAGVGKTLYKKRMVCKLNNLFPKKVNQPSNNLSIPLHEKVLKTDDVMSVLLDMTLPPGSQEPRIFHFDISHEVEEGVDFFLFQLLILGCLTDSSGYVWRKSVMDYYIIESMPLLSKETDAKSKRFKCLHHCLDVLPHVMCRSPQESLDIINHTRTPPDYACQDLLFDSVEFQSATFQRPYQYLKRLDTNKELHQLDPSKPEGTLADCLLTLLRHCGIKDPSWSELHHFVSFLDKQLQAFEVSSFCSSAVLEDLPGFPKFVLKFLIQMSRDFSTRSLKISEESPIDMFKRHLEEADEEDDVSDDLVQLYQMRRTWETSPHPYLFFNPDGHSMTFLGFNIDQITGNLIDRQTNKILEKGIMQKQLWEALGRNHVDLAENFDALSRDKKIKKLCNVMGIETAHDPDQTYELTTDNVKKMLAIYMRFRCDIPVIIMGETGCGKTRLVKFMCELQTPPRTSIKNMILMKVHGGTKPSDIINKVEEAEKIAEENTNLIKNYPGYTHMDTVLFFDEANTTEAIGIIKEIMCDKSLKGRPIELHKRLKIVAACNPYRKHSDELIKRLEQAGLGYHVDADRTSDRLGRVPMRRLVYRVQPLPQSMLPLVWDFGQLNIDVEEMYIRQMVLRYINEHRIPSRRGLDTTISKILTISQDFMRKQKDECSFVSLRDVERVLDVMSWFYSKSAENDILFSRRYVNKDLTDYRPLTNIATRSLVMALGVCYHACLKKRSEYRTTIAKFFTAPLELPGGAAQFEEEITCCQSAFLDHIELAPNIAKNQALRENVFMMIVCIELRIPMFLVGKPGSSKSLAKTIVADAMQGNTDNELFKHYKQAHMVSFQCSPLSTPDGIVSTFSQCAAYQKEKELNRFVSVVVLDEVGLAEDSPKMPLKTLHPLLEDGCTGDEKPERYKKVAFIGISNWALDPAKMNRGILVQREVPDIEELINSANGICSSDKQVQSILEPMISPMAVSYLQLFIEASVEMREFFGLRDFYSLIKMLYGFILKSKEKPTMYQLKHSILRNFGGLEMINPVIIFLKNLASQVNENEPRKDTDPICTPEGMIKACLRGDSQSLR